MKFSCQNEKFHAEMNNQCRHKRNMQKQNKNTQIKTIGSKFVDISRDDGMPK